MIWDGLLVDGVRGLVEEREGNRMRSKARSRGWNLRFEERKRTSGHEKTNHTWARVMYEVEA